MSKSKKMNVEVKRKASSLPATDNDNLPKSNIKQSSATFSFSQNDIESSTDAADKLKPNLNINNGKAPKSQSDIFRFLASKQNFKVRKKMRLT